MQDESNANTGGVGTCRLKQGGLKLAIKALWHTYQEHCPVQQDSRCPHFSCALISWCC